MAFSGQGGPDDLRQLLALPHTQIFSLLPPNTKTLILQLKIAQSAKLPPRTRSHPQSAPPRKLRLAMLLLALSPEQELEDLEIFQKNISNPFPDLLSSSSSSEPFLSTGWVCKLLDVYLCCEAEFKVELIMGHDPSLVSKPPLDRLLPAAQNNGGNGEEEEEKDRERFLSGTQKIFSCARIAPTKGSICATVG
ncbi:uncharacterized protein LOC116197072 [Punica granatum]|uniref:Uncharacterized protein LOC116197072 n=2 Tax=Punica granatum TaxID=22663 RepID=A0A6P8CKP2_PUNGR|nr:uncharacterized protein LOC116197072 [Punica granatum]PKI58789.1 hypothetical protein CRG98_020779 [Punica granatum]